MGNQWTKVSNKTDADFYVITFNDADLVYSTYFEMKRVPAGQTVQVECAAGDAIKVGICYYIPGSVGYNKGDFDMWRVRNNRTMNIVFIGDKRGAGLDSKNNDLKYYNYHTYRFNSSDSSAVQATMKDIAQWEKDHPNQQVIK